MNLAKLDELLINEPRFRKKQIYQMIFDELIEDWDQATVLPKTLREQLTKDVPLTINAVPFISKESNTTKALITLSDGLKIETVLMQYEGRNSVCVSSQVGCGLGCRFCATGKLGFKRNLTSGEILDQVLYFARQLKQHDERVTNVVVMGMGEPFLNYDAVMTAIIIMNSQEGLHIGARKISISTSGIVAGIEQFTKEPLDINLALSLHAPNQTLRSELMPISKKYPLEEVLKAIKHYIAVKNRKVMIEYILIGGINDSDMHAQQLADLLVDLRHLYHVNLIQYNPTGAFNPSTKERMNAFLKILSGNHISASERFRFGRDINASCGQLALNNH